MTTNTEMPDSNDSSGFLDDTRSEVTVASGQPKGSTLRQRHHLSLTECAADYADLFRALQIRPEMHERFLEGLLRKVRQKHIKELQKGTDASIRGLTRLVVRGYRAIVWKEGSEWLLKDEDLDEGEERLLHGGDNEQFHPLLEPVWWRMRDLVFEPKVPLKTRFGRKKDAHKDGNAEDAYEADADTELDIREPHDRAREQMLHRINKLIAGAPEPSHRYMSADETDQAIVDLVVQLADTRARSDPAVFQRIWDQHIGRIDELENSGSGDQVDAVRRIPISAFPKISNLSNEPFATAGNPLPQSWPQPLPSQVPAVMTVYITTAPAESPYTHRAYEWLDAPVRMVDQRAFYDRLMLRVNIRAECVQGMVMSYGWCDVCQWVPKGAAAERDGWETLQRDLAWAAGRGVRVWRMKVLVVRS